MAACFLYHYLNGPLPYVRRHITINKNVLSVLLTKTIPFFLPYIRNVTNKSLNEKLKVLVLTCELINRYNILLFHVLYVN